MASASMPSNSSITPIFSDEEAQKINDYFAKLIKIQRENLWSGKYTQNYLTIKDLDFLDTFIGEKLLEDHKSDGTNSNSPNIIKISDFWILFDNIIQNYKVNILGKKRNNITIKNNIKELNNSGKKELISIINSLIDNLIKKIILNPIYFNQTQLSSTLSGKSFIFMKDDELQSILNELDEKRILNKSLRSMKRSGAQYVATQKAVEAAQKVAQEAAQKEAKQAAEKAAQNKRINAEIARRFKALRSRGGTRKLTKNKTTKNKKIKNKTTKNKK